jgi:hypothetical protein
LFVWPKTSEAFSDDGSATPKTSSAWFKLGCVSILLRHDSDCSQQIAGFEGFLAFRITPEVDYGSEYGLEG